MLTWGNHVMGFRLVLDRGDIVFVNHTEEIEVCADIPRASTEWGIRELAVGDDRKELA